LTEKYLFFLLLRNKKYAKKGIREFVQLGETVKIGSETPPPWEKQQVMLKLI
jgi:hypothetical protein